MADPADTSLRALGLSTDPFATPSDDLFGGGDRMRQLDELRHLSRWSRRLLVVTGERGIGKSTLYRALASRLDPGVKAARINANLANEARELLTSIVQGFGIATPAKVTPELLGELISVHVAEQSAARRACVVLVDDAHQVELRALDQLLRLTEAGGDDGLRIVFFGEAYFVQMLGKAVSRLATPLPWHEIRLAPFSAEEVRQYLKFRLEGAGHEGRLPFTEGEVHGIVQTSGGLPGKVDEIASEILSGVMTVRDTTGWLPPWHRALVALLVVAIGITWLMWDRSDAAEPATTVAIPAREPASQDVAVAQLPGIAAADAAAEAEVTLVDTAPNSASGAPPVTTRLRAPEQVAATQPSNPAPAPNLAPAPNPAPDEFEDDPPAQKPAITPQRVEKTTQPKPAATPEKTVAKKAAPNPRDAQFDLKWIDAQPDDRFTLQLLGTSSRARAEEYVVQQGRGAPAVAFLSERNANPWYVVIYGSYESADAASSAARRLPATIGKVTPWVRRFAAVRSDIKR